MNINDIEVIDPIIITHNSNTMSTETKNPAELTEEELTALLEKKRESKKLAITAAKNTHEADKNKFVTQSGDRFQELQSEMVALKKRVTERAVELYEDMYKIEGKKPRETKSFSLKNTEDTVKVTVDRQERFVFTDEAIVHINAIKDIFKAKFAKRNKALYGILDGLLIKGTKGEYDPKLLAKAGSQVRKLGDENLISEFDKLSDCQRVTSTALYCRVYVKDDKGRYQDISLQFSSL